MAQVRSIEKLRRQRLIRTVIWRVLVALLVVLLIYAVYTVRGDIGEAGLSAFVSDSLRNLFAEQSFPVTVEGGDIYTAGSRIVVQSGGEFLFYTEKGLEVHSLSPGFRNPQILSHGGVVFIYDPGSGGVYIDRNGTRLFSIEADHSIYTATYSESGMFAISHTSENYSSQVTVYGSDFSDYLHLMYTDEIIITTDINERGTLVATGGFGTRGGSLYSQVNLYSQNDETPRYSLLLDEELVMDIDIRSDGSLMLLTDKTLSLISASGEVLRRVELSAAPRSFHVTESGGMLLELSSYGELHRSELAYYSAELVLEGSMSLDEQMESLLSSGDTLLLFDGEAITVYDSTLVHLSTTEIQDAVSVTVLDDNIYYTTNSELRTVPIVED